MTLAETKQATKSDLMALPIEELRRLANEAWAEWGTPWHKVQTALEDRDKTAAAEKLRQKIRDEVLAELKATWKGHDQLPESASAHA